MGAYAGRFGPHDPDATYVAHRHAEQRFDAGEVVLNYATVGDPDHPALLLIPGQSESWWGYEDAMGLLADHFCVFAVDLRGQGRSTRTPGRYTLDNMGNDLVRFIDGVIARPTIVSGLSSGGVLSAWLSAYARPGQVLACCYEDPPLFASEVDTSCGPSLRQAIGPLFALWSKYLGDQWSIGDWEGMVAAAPSELPAWLAALFGGVAGAAPPQQLREYDPEWGRAFWSGTVAASCRHDRMLAAVKVPVLLTHHFWQLEPTTGALLGAISGEQVARAVALIEAAGQPVEVREFPAMGHAMHSQDPALFASTIVGWAAQWDDRGSPPPSSGALARGGSQRTLRRRRADERVGNREGGGRSLTKYLITLGARAMDHLADEEMPAVARAAHAVCQEAIDASVFVVAGGLEDERASLVAVDGTVRDGTPPDVVGGFMIVDVPSRDAALQWAAKIAAACRCEQEVRAIGHDPELEAMLRDASGVRR